jgi:SAM-dependent methyltransferase
MNRWVQRCHHRAQQRTTLYHWIVRHDQSVTSSPEYRQPRYPHLMLAQVFPTEIICCPVCGGDLDMQAAITCQGCSAVYPRVDGIPVLVDFETSVIDREKLLQSHGRHAVKRLPPYRHRLYQKLLGVDRSTLLAVPRITAALRQLPHRPRLLMVGGGTIGSGMQPFYDDDRIEVIGFDIYASPTVHLIADGHHMPFKPECFDAVIIQAVLEHVLEPATVVAEIHRVLRPDGLVYAGTPFMQQVHEGAFDFLRFTESGHRWLFRRFHCLASGSEGGPGETLIWAIQYFVSGLFRSRKIGRLAQLSVLWLRWFDRLIPEAWRIDGACGVFFLGSKIDGTLTAQDILVYYQGAQR